MNTTNTVDTVIKAAAVAAIFVPCVVVGKYIGAVAGIAVGVGAAVHYGPKLVDMAKAKAHEVNAGFQTEAILKSIKEKFHALNNSVVCADIGSTGTGTADEDMPVVVVEETVVRRKRAPRNRSV